MTHIEYLTENIPHRHPPPINRAVQIDILLLGYSVEYSSTRVEDSY